MRQAAVPCEFLGEWRDVEIHVQLQLTEKGKLKLVRRLLRSKPHTLEEALDFARTQEMSDKQAKLKGFSKVKEQAPMMRRGCTKSGHRDKAMFVARRVFLVVGYFRTEGDGRNAHPGEKDVGHATG